MKIAPMNLRGHESESTTLLNIFMVTLNLKKFSRRELLSGTADANSKVIAAFYALQACGRGRIAQV
jgi:hypothetical protein